MFRAYRPPPRNTSTDAVNTIAPLAGGILGAVVGAKTPIGPMAGYQIGSGLGQAGAALAVGGPDQEQRAASGQALALQGLGRYYADKKQYGKEQMGDGVAPKPTATEALTQASKTGGVLLERSPGAAPDVLDEQAWRYKGMPLMSKSVY